MSTVPLNHDLATIPIPFPINFVMESLEGWEAAANAVEAPDPDAMPERFRDPETSWLVQSYLRLKRRGHRVRLTCEFVPGEVCVSLRALRGSNRPYHSFSIAIQCHLLLARICDFNIVQNKLQVHRANQQWLPHWPQPGLIRREASRGSRLERIAYFGEESLMTDFASEAFRSRVADLGMTLVTPEQWNDYSDTDAVLAVRSLPQSYLAFKPASKLYNAWLAGCPALLGPEPAFAAHRKSELDYFEVRTPAEALAALTCLKNEPGLYQKIVANGLERSREINFDAVARAWEELLTGPVAERFYAWSRGPKLWRVGRNLSQFSVRWGLHKKALKDVDRFNEELVQTGHDWRAAGKRATAPTRLEPATTI